MKKRNREKLTARPHFLRTKTHLENTKSDLGKTKTHFVVTNAGLIIPVKIIAVCCVEYNRLFVSLQRITFINNNDMKQHHYLCVACVALMTACMSEIDLGDEIQESEGVTSLNVLNDRRSYGEALEVARGAVAMLEQEETLPQRSVTKKQNRRVDLSDGVKCITGKKRVMQRGGEPVVVDDTLMYVFNYENNQGYALVSTNLATEPLIAVTEQGHYDPAQETDNPGLKLYLEMAKQYVAKTKRMDSISVQQNLMERIPYKYRRRYDTLQRTRVIPKIAVKWGQQNPEGWACPNGLSGCINTASA